MQHTSPVTSHTSHSTRHTILHHATNKERKERGGEHDLAALHDRRGEGREGREGERKERGWRGERREGECEGSSPVHRGPQVAPEPGARHPWSPPLCPPAQRTCAEGHNEELNSDARPPQQAPGIGSHRHSKCQRHSTVAASGPGAAAGPAGTPRVSSWQLLPRTRTGNHASWLVLRAPATWLPASWRRR